jgi:hypothetical protein
MSQHRAIIDAVGGPALLATVFGISEETTRCWRRPGRGIPPRYWHQFRQFGVQYTPEYLARTAPKRRVREAAE